MDKKTKRNVESTYAAYCVRDMEGKKKEQNGPVVRMSCFRACYTHTQRQQTEKKKREKKKKPLHKRKVKSSAQVGR